MDYVIDQILPHSIIVTFADGTRANVGVSTSDSPEMIDHLVSMFDPEFQPDPEQFKNCNVVEGEERCSCPMESMEEVAAPEVEEEVVDSEVPPILDPFNLSTLMYTAIRRENEGDSAVMEALGTYYDSYLSQVSNEDLVEFINQCMANREAADMDNSAADDEIFAQAMKELEDE